jgi:hypothetical protein
MRFLLERYSHSVVGLVRYLIVILVPVATQNSALQDTGVTAVLFGYILVQRQRNPWRIYAARVLEGMITASFVFVHLSGSLYTDMKEEEDEEEEETTLSILELTCFVLFCVLVIVGLCTVSTNDDCRATLQSVGAGPN